jgi:hypothetical protein
MKLLPFALGVIAGWCGAFWFIDWSLRPRGRVPFRELDQPEGV